MRVKRRSRRLRLGVVARPQAEQIRPRVHVAVVDDDAAGNVAMVFVDLQVEHVFPFAFHVISTDDHPRSDI